MLEPKIITVGEHQYTLGRLDMFQALNVSRLAAPLLPILFHEVFSRVAMELLKGDEKTDEERVEAIGRLVQMSEPLLRAIATMPEKNFETIVRTCLSCAERKVGRSWARVMLDGQLAFQDITQHEVLSIVIHVLCRELRPTIAALGLCAGAAVSEKQKAKATSTDSLTESTT